MARNTNKRAALKHMASLPSGAHALAAQGPKTEAVVHRLLDSEATASLFVTVDQGDFKKLADAFKEWSDEESARIVDEYAQAMSRHRRLDASALCRWVLSHSNDAAAVLDCMSVDPPEDINIIRVLSRAGSQKLVFLATWRLTQRQVVLKKLTGPPELQQVVMRRESQSHPLSMVHQNIIETHYLSNGRGESFPVEDYLPFLLSDGWRSNGIHEAANLLFDISSALRFLHEDLHLVHGDVKPDNIGRKGDNYILLDFGICRAESDFAADATATGSLRTRAPELFETDSYPHPTKVDVWALGATVFNSVVGRFPFFDRDESPPRVSTPEEREQFELQLRKRVENEWQQRVDLSSIPNPLRDLLRHTLERNPERRYSAEQVCAEAERNLSAYLRQGPAEGRFSPLQELEQLDRHLGGGAGLRLMPQTEKQELLRRLDEIRQTTGLETAHRDRIQGLVARIS